MAVDYENFDDDLMEDLLVTLDNDGEDIETKPLTIFEMEGRDYIVLATVDEEEEITSDAELFIFRYNEDENGEPSIEDIEDEGEYEKASDRLEQIIMELPEEDEE